MVGFLEIQGPNCREILHRPLPKATHFCLKKKKKNPKENPCTREVEDPLTGLSHFHYGNDTELAEAPVDLASEQNHIGPPGQYLTSLDSSGSVRPVSLKPGLSIHPHPSNKQENAHSDNSCNYDRVVRERGRQVIHKMWSVGQEHDVIRIFSNTRGCPQEGTGESTGRGRQLEGTVKSTSREPSYGQDWLSRPRVRLLCARQSDRRLAAICRGCGPIPVARGGSGAKVPPLAARPSLRKQGWELALAYTIQIHLETGQGRVPGANVTQSFGDFQPPNLICTRVPGLSQITWRIILIKKIEGPLLKKLTEVKK